MDLTKYENQINALRRCITNVQSAENHVYKVKLDRINYESENDHSEAIDRAKLLWENSKKTLIAQLRLNNMLNQEELR